MMGRPNNTTSLAARSVLLVVVSLFALVPIAAAADAAEKITDRADALFGVAEKHYSAGEWQQAIDRFTAILQSHPKDPRIQTARFYIAEALMQLGRCREALVLFREIQKNNPPQERAARINFRIGEAAFFANELETARDKLQVYREQHPNNRLAIEAALLLGHAEQHLGRHDAALAIYHAIVEQHPKSRQMPLALLAAAELHDQLEQNQEARQLYERFIHDFSGHPQLEEAVFQLGWLLREMEETDQETKLWRLLNTTIPTGRHWNEATYLLARRRFDQGEMEEAERLLLAWLENNRTVREAPGSGIEKLPNPNALGDRGLTARVLYLQAQIAAAGERWSDIGPPLEALIARFPESPMQLPARFWIAEANFRDGNYGLANQQFEQLARLVSGQAFHLELPHRKALSGQSPIRATTPQDKFDKAQVDGNKEDWVAMIPLRQAQILARQGAWIAAFGMANAIADKYPNFTLQYEVDYVLGRCLASRGELADAREAYRRAIASPHGAKTETAAMAQWMIGETYLHQQNYAAALDEYLKAQEYAAYPLWQARAALQAGTCYERMHTWREAEQLYATASERFSETDVANELAARRDQARKKSQEP